MKKLSGKKKLAIILAAFALLLIAGFTYSVIWRLQYSNQMIESGCRVHAYDWLGLPISWDCPVNLQVINV